MADEYVVHDIGDRKGVTEPAIEQKHNADGKIVEFSNHRHDIDIRQTLKFTLQGLLIGLVIALIPTILLFRQRQLLKEWKANTE